MKKIKEIVLYDDTENYKKFDETRDFLFAFYADENGWACKENIPDETVYKEIDFQNQNTLLPYDGNLRKMERQFRRRNIHHLLPRFSIYDSTP